MIIYIFNRQNFYIAVINIRHKKYFSKHYMMIYVLQWNTGYQGMMVCNEWYQLVWFCFVFRGWEGKGVACHKGEYCGPWALDLLNSRQSFQLKGSFVCYLELLQPKWFVYIQYFITLKMFASVVYKLTNVVLV